MSHTTTISKVKIKDINALKSAVESLQKEGVNCELVENTTARMYYQRQTEELGTLDYVLKLKDSPYDIAFVKEEDGSYSTSFDEWGGHISKQVGFADQVSKAETDADKVQAGIGKLMQHYSTHAAINAFQEQGHTVQNVYTDENGVVQIEAEVAEYTQDFGYDTGANY